MSFSELIPNKNVRAILVGEWKVFLTNAAGTNGHPPGKEKKNQSQFLPYTIEKFNFRWYLTWEWKLKL